MGGKEPHRHTSDWHSAKQRVNATRNVNHLHGGTWNMVELARRCGLLRDGMSLDLRPSVAQCQSHAFYIYMFAYLFIIIYLHVFKI